MKIEIIGLPQENRYGINQWMFGNAREIKRIFDCVSIPREKIDPRIIELEERLHSKNKSRCKFYGLTYIRPKVIYLDLGEYHKNLSQLNFEISKTFFLIKFDFRFSGVFVDITNTLLIPNKSFQDRDIDDSFTSHCLRHEMAHAGSVRKLRVYDIGDTYYAIDFYRGGAIINVGNGFFYGKVLDEGHNYIEDILYFGGLPDKIKYWRAERFFDEGETLDKKYKNVNMELILKRLSELEEKDELTKKYKNYKDLMIEIYDRDPELFRLAEDLIYGDRMIPFARRIDQIFGKKFFDRLMRIGSGDEACKLLQEIK